MSFHDHQKPGTAWTLFGWALAVPLGMLLTIIVLFTPLIERDLDPQDFKSAFYSPQMVKICLPKQVDQVRYLGAITVIPLIIGITALVLSRKFKGNFISNRALPMWIAAALVGQVGLAAFVAIMEIKQNPGFLRPREGWGLSLTLTILVVAAFRSWFKRAGSQPKDDVLNRVNRWFNSIAGLIFMIVAVGLFTLVQIQNSIFDADSLYATPLGVWYHAQYTFAEFEAVNSGLTLQVDFFPLYNYLLPYLTAVYFDALGPTIGSYSGLMMGLIILGMILVFDHLRRITESATGAASMALPLIGMCCNLHYHESYFPIAPMRLLGPWVVAWVTVWHLQKPNALRRRILLTSGVLAAINNPDFGVVTLGAAGVVALFSTDDTIWPKWRHIARVVAETTSLIILVLGLFIEFTWLRCGRFPDLRQVIEQRHLYTVWGAFNLPTPAYGTHWVYYVVFMAGISTAVFQLAQQGLSLASSVAVESKDRLISGALLYWSLFGAGSMAYFMGRSIDGNLRAILIALGMSILLMGYSLIRGGLGRIDDQEPWILWWIRVAPAIPLGLFYLLAVTYLPPTPPLDPTPDALKASAKQMDDFRNAHSNIIHRLTGPGDKYVCILLPLGHMMAMENDVTNVFPFPESTSVILNSQVQTIIDAIERNHVHLVYGFIPFPSLQKYLKDHGFKLNTELSAGIDTVWYLPPEKDKTAARQ